MKSPRIAWAALLVAAVCVFAGGTHSGTVPAGNLEIVRVVGHHFTTSISNGKRIATVDKPPEARYLVIKIEIKVPDSETKIFTNDFTLQYWHQDGHEDRTQCTSVCRAATDKLGEDDGCAMGNAGWVLLDSERKYLTLAFFIESDVDAVNICRLGGPSLKYEIGSERPYSVFISTNQQSDTMSKVAASIRDGGYQVTNLSTSLAGDVGSKVIVHYAKGAEIQAREISQRIMLTLGKAPTLEKMNLASDHDIVIWLGI